MKVYELMKELADMPAGNEVKISAIISTEEFTNGPDMDDDRVLILLDVIEIKKDSKAIYISA